jgi:hypothetical protein
MMKRRFVNIFESVMQRYTCGGFLAGDVVTFKKEALSSDWFKSLGVNTQEKIKQMVNSGLNLRISAIKNMRPNVGGAGNTDFTGTEVNLDITSEIAPGRYADFVTIPGNVVETKGSYPNLPAVPDVFKKDDPAKRTHIKPKKVEKTKDQTPFLAPNQNKISDLGNGKMSEGDRELKNTNIKIPSQPVKGASDPATYTYQYLPNS